MFSGGGLLSGASASNAHTAKGPAETTPPNSLASTTGTGQPSMGLFGGAVGSLFQPTAKDAASSQTGGGLNTGGLFGASAGSTLFGKAPNTSGPSGESKGASSNVTSVNNNSASLIDIKGSTSTSNALGKNETASLFKLDGGNAQSQSGATGSKTRQDDNVGKRDSLKLGSSSDPKGGEGDFLKGSGDGEGGAKKEEPAKSTVALNDTAVAEELALQSKMEEVLQTWERKLARQTEDFKKYSRAVSEMDTLIFQLVDKLVEIQKNQESVQSKQIDLTALVKRVERRQDQMRQNIQEMETRVNAEISDSRIPVGQLETHAHRINSQLQAIEKEVGQIAEEMETMQEKAYPEGLGRLLLLINSEKRTLERIRQEIDSFCAPE